MNAELTQADADRLNEVLLAYVEAVEAGQQPDRERLVAEHPHLAGPLREFFAARDQVSHLAGALRDRVRSTPTTPPVGELGDFRLLREVGRGGMGVVYEAEQISLHRKVALKVLPFAAALDPRQLQRFRTEAQAAAQLHHPGIVPVFAVGCERGVHYYAMQFIEGQSLAALLQGLRETQVAEPTQTTLGPLAALLSTDRSAKPRAYFHNIARLGKQAAEALEQAHQMGVVHRDIKPANLLLDNRGQLWVADFGLAQFQRDTGLTATNEVLGTLRYASPEQARTRPGVVDQRSDVYSLGATLYELLTLKPVFDGRDRGELLRQITFDEPAAPRVLDRTIPVELETIVLKALAKAPADRYATARELADDLQRFLDDKPILARRPTWLERSARWARRHRAVVVSALVLLAAGVIGLGVSTFLIAQAYEAERVRTMEANDSALEAQRKAKEAREAQARAEEDFRLAKRAVDMLTQMAEEEMAGNPMLQSTRRKMLVAALSYYQEFLDRHGDDPGLQSELAVSHARVTRLLAELSALEGYGQLLVVLDSRVQGALKATPEQREQLKALGEQMLAQWGKTWGGLSALTPERRQTKLAEMAGEHARAVLAILTTEQAKRLQQIGLQLQQQGPNGFRDPELIAALQLDAKQVQAIRKLQQDAFQPPPFGGPPDALQRWREAQEKVQKQILQVMTEEQRGRWLALTGEPFYGGPGLIGPGLSGPGGFGMPPGFGPGPPGGPRKGPPPP